MSVDLNLPEDRVGPRPRRKSKRVWVGGTAIGDGAPVSVQSMCTTLTHDVDATIRQITTNATQLTASQAVCPARISAACSNDAPPRRISDGAHSM